jgi:hypothetical protein
MTRNVSMHRFEKLIRTTNNGECAVVSLTDRDAEGECYTSFNESGVPKPIMDLMAFCDQHEIQIDVHRKPVTYGCIEAVQARSIACGADVQLHQELKAIVLKTAENIKIAVYMCGDRELPKLVSPRGKRYGVDCDLISSVTGFSVLGMDDDPQLISGRLNPITLSLNFDDQIEHFFDIPDHVLTGPMYTNGGCNTWGVRIDDVPRMLSKVGAIRLEGLCCPVSSGASRKVGALEVTKVYQEKVA